MMNMKGSSIGCSSHDETSEFKTKKRHLSMPMSPAEYVKCLVPEDCRIPQTTEQRRLSLDKTQASDGYTMEVVGAIRSNDVTALRHMLEKEQREWRIPDPSGLPSREARNGGIPRPRGQGPSRCLRYHGTDHRARLRVEGHTGSGHDGDHPPPRIAPSLVRARYPGSRSLRLCAQRTLATMEFLFTRTSRDHSTTLRGGM